MADSVDALIEARQHRAAETHERVRSALARLRDAGVRPTPSALAKEAGVSRTTIYRHYRDDLTEPAASALQAAVDTVPEDNLVQTLARRMKVMQREHREEVAQLKKKLYAARSEIARLQAEKR